MADNVRMTRQLKYAAGLVRRIELVSPDLDQCARRHVRTEAGIAIHGQIGRVVANPLYGDLDNARRLPIGQDFVWHVVGHERRVVDEPQLADDVQRVTAKVPRRSTNADGSNS